MKELSQLLIEKLCHQQVDEKLVITKDTKEKDKNLFYEFTKYPEQNKILTLCGFNDSDNKPDRKIFIAVNTATNGILLRKNEKIFALVDQDMYNLLDKKYSISDYKDYVIIDNKLYDEYFANRFIESTAEHSIEADYYISIYDYHQPHGKGNKFLYTDKRNPDERIDIFFIKK